MVSVMKGLTLFFRSEVHGALNGVSRAVPVLVWPGSPTFRIACRFCMFALWLDSLGTKPKGSFTNG